MVTSATSKIDILDRVYIGRVWLYIFCGLLDAMWQTIVYWLMGVMSRNPATLAHFVGFCRSLWWDVYESRGLRFTQTRGFNQLVPQAYGEPMGLKSRAWGCHLSDVELIVNISLCYSYMQIFISTWVLLAAGLMFALPMILMRVTEGEEVDGIPR